MSFEAALDGLRPQKSDAILVLRNWDKEENRQRVELGTELLVSNWANVMLLMLTDSTKGEALKMVNMIRELGWGSLLLVTHKYHSYRAYLTFIKWLEGMDIRVYVKSIPSGVSLGEMGKIEQYSRIGDCATYEEGLEYLKWLP